MPLTKLNFNCKDNPGQFMKMGLEITMTQPFRLQEGSCGHTLHPVGAPTVASSCPFCRTSSLLQSVQDCVEDWKSEGGPWPGHELTVSTKYDKARTQWYVWKAKLLNYMHELELYAAEEIALKDAYPGLLLESFGEAALKIRSSEDALTQARMGMPHFDVVKGDWEDGGQEEAITCQVSKNKVPEAKASVRFVNNACDHPKRPQRLFNRNAAQYQPGRRAAPEDESWIDTSMANLDDYQMTVYNAQLDRMWKKAETDTTGLSEQLD